MVEGGALSQEDFAEWSKDVVLFCHITSRVETDKHQDLLSEKGGQGFPHFAIMDAEGAVLKIHDGSRDVSGFKASVAQATETQNNLAALDTKAEGGDKDAAKEAFMIRLDLGHFTYAKAIEASKKLEFDDAGKAELKGLLASLRVKELMATVTSREEFNALGATFVKMADAGEIPTSEDVVQQFWIGQMQWAESNKDAKVFRRALENLEAKFGNNPRAKQFFDARRKTLEELEAASEETVEEEVVEESPEK